MPLEGDKVNHVRRGEASWAEESTPAAPPGQAAREQPPSIAEHELLFWIGGGSYGEVWLARSVLGTYRAIKIVHRRDFEKHESFDREFNGLQKFEPISRTHDGLVNILQVGQTEENFYYIMELADAGNGGDLSVEDRTQTSYIPRTLRSDLTRRGWLPVEECLRIGLRIASALAHLHQHGLVHRDVKPSNIIFVRGEPKLADIGLVTEATEAHSLVGTVGYIPPDGPGSPQADLFGLGKVLYEISTGCRRDEFPRLPIDVQERPDREDLVELNEVILKACENDPKARYQSAEEMHAHLRRVQDGKSVRRIRWLEKRLALGRKVGLALLVSALVAGLISYQAWRGRQIATQHLARLHLEQGIRLMEDGDRFGSLLRFSRGLEMGAGDQLQEANHRIRIGTILQHCPKPVGIFGAETSPVRGADFSPDGRHVLTMDDDRAVRVWSMETEDLLHTLPHDTSLVDALYSPDGEWILTTRTGARAQVWNATTGQRSGLPFGHLSAPLPSKAFGSFYILFFATNGVRILKSFEELSAEPAQLPQENVVLVFCLTGEGEKVWVKARVESTEGKVLFDRDYLDWPQDPDQTVPRQEIPSFVGVQGSLMLSLVADSIPNDTSDHEIVFDDLQAALFDVQSGTRLRSRVVADFNDNRRGNWDCRGTTNVQLIFTNQQFSLRAPNWDLGHAASAELIGELFGIEDGRRLEVRVKVVRARNASPGLGFWIKPFYHYQRTQNLSFRPQTLAFSPDGRHVACLRSFNQAEVRNLPSGELINQLPIAPDWLRSIWYSPDGQRVFSAAGSRVYVWDPSTGQPAGKPFNHGADIRLAGMSMDGRWMVTLGDGLFRIWDVARGVLLPWTNASPSTGTGFAFSPDGARLLVIDGDEVVQCLDTATGSPLLPDLQHEYPVLLCGFSPDARRIVTLTDKHLCHLWHATDGQPIAPPLPHYGPAGLPKFSPDGRFLLTVDPPRGAFLWDLSKIDPVILSIPLSAGYTPAAQSPNGQFQVSFADDIRLALENKSSGQSVPFPRSGRMPPLKQVKFTADSRWLLVEGRDASVQIWDVQSGDLLTPRLAGRYRALSAGFPEIRLPCDNRPLPDLIALAELLSQSRLDPDGGTVPLGGDELRKRWSGLRQRYPNDFDRLPADPVQWHQNNALHCEQDWDWWGAQFHLRRLAQLQPQDTRVAERLGYVQQALASVESRASSWSDRAKIIPPRPPQATVHHLDLTRSTTPQGLTNFIRSVKDHFLSGGPGPNRLGELPCGIQNLAGVEWDIRCFVRLGRKPWGGALLFPTNVTVPVGQTCKRIHFLHASDDMTPLWNEVGRYILHFADGTQSELPIRSRFDLFCYRMGGTHPLALFRSDDSHSHTAVPAWAGTISAPQSKGGVVRLFKFTWENPKVPQEVTSIELKSGQSPVAAPFVVAITVE